jgi:hypothetical protein
VIFSSAMSQTMEIVPNIQHKKIVLNVRRNGPQPSIFVRSFSQITTGRRGAEISRLLRCEFTTTERGRSPLEWCLRWPMVVLLMLGGNCKSQDSVGEISTGIWVGTWSEKWSVWQENDPQNDTIFSR